MRRFILTRLGGLVVVLWLLVTVVFFLGAVVPSDPARSFAGAGASPAVIAAKRHELQLDKPLLTRYGHYLGQVVHGNLSESIHTRQPVRDDLRHALPATLELMLFAVLLTVLVGGAVGMLTTRSTRASKLVGLVLTAGASVPAFSLALLLLLLLYSKLHLVPAGGRLSPDRSYPSGPTGFLTIDGLLGGRLDVTFDALWHVLLPAVCLALTPALLTARILRSSLRHALRQDYTRTARAKGLTDREVLWRHALRNALNAPLTIAGLQLGAMLAGDAVVETIFSWPGIGLYIDRSIATDDFPAIAGVTLLVGLVFVIANALVDVAQMAADPRLRA